MPECTFLTRISRILFLCSQESGGDSRGEAEGERRCGECRLRSLLAGWVKRLINKAAVIYHLLRGGWDDPNCAPPTRAFGGRAHRERPSYPAPFFNSLLGKDRSPERDDPFLERGQPTLFDWCGSLLACRLWLRIGGGRCYWCCLCRYCRLGSRLVRN